MIQSKLQVIEEKFNRIIGLFYCLLILVLPVSIALVEIMASLIVLFFLIKKVTLNTLRVRSKEKPRWRELFVPDVSGGAKIFQITMGMFILSVLVSVLFSRFPAISWIAFFSKVLEGYYLYFAFVDCIKTQLHLRNCVVFTLAAAFVISIDGLFQFFFGKDLLRQMPLEGNRVSATLRHANDFGAYLVTAIPLIFGLMVLPLRQGASLVQQWVRGNLAENITSKIILGLTFLLMLACLGLTFSRGSWVGFWFSMFIFVIFLRKYLFHVLVVSLVFLAVFLPFLMKYRDVSFTTDQVSITRTYGNIEDSPENLSRLDQTTRDRVDLAHSFQLGMGRFGFWEHALDVIKKSPFFGNGLNSYSKLAKVYAHNCYLQMAAEIGFLGLLAFLVMIGVLFRYSWSAMLTIERYQDKVLLAGFSAGLAGFFMQSFFDTTLYSVQLSNLMWVLIGFIVVIPRIAHSSE